MWILAERLVVIGGDAGGMTAASQARKRKSADELEIVAFERGHFAADRRDRTGHGAERPGAGTLPTPCGPYGARVGDAPR